MLTSGWVASHVVFVTEMDDDHLEIFQAVAAFTNALAAGDPPEELRKLTEVLAARIEGHFAHEERLMRAARYGSYRWHKRLHDSALKRTRAQIARVDAGEPGAGRVLIDFLKLWLDEHTRLADMMLGAFLRNHRRGLCRVTFRAGTKPMDACNWVNSRGEKFDPAAETRGY